MCSQKLYPIEAPWFLSFPGCFLVMVCPVPLESHAVRLGGSSLLSPGFDIRLWFVYLLIDEEHFALMFSFLVPLAFGECVGQVRVRGWSTSFPPQLQLLFLGEDGAAPFLTQQGEPISPSAALAGL